MDTLVVKELTDFRDAANRAVIADGLSQPRVNDKILLNQLVQFGNAYIERARTQKENRDAVIWFDIHFGDPAVLGMTWAYNPFKPRDEKHDCEHGFWRMWSETDPDLGTLAETQEEWSSYCLQHMPAVSALQAD